MTVSCEEDEDDYEALWTMGGVREDFEEDDAVLLLMAREEFERSAAEGGMGRRLAGLRGSMRV